MITYQPGDPKSGDLKDTGSLIGHRTGTLLYVTVLWRHYPRRLS